MWYFAVFPAKPSAIICDVRRGLERLVGEYGLEWKFDVQVTASVEECLDDIRMLDGMDTVFLSGVHSHDRNTFLKILYCRRNLLDLMYIAHIQQQTWKVWYG